MLSGATGSSVAGGYNGSVTTAATSTSENWETYSDASDNELSYYAPQQQQQRPVVSKRPATANGMHLGAVKRVREHALANEAMDAGGSRVGSWATEDEGVVGETY
jgi:hypothetical protein